MRRRLRNVTTLTFNRTSSDDATIDDYGRIVEGETVTSFEAVGSLQPVSDKEKKTIPSADGVILSEAYYFYTDESDILPIESSNVTADKTTINGVVFVVWANARWESVQGFTSHNIITLLREDEVAHD